MIKREKMREETRPMGKCSACISIRHAGAPYSSIAFVLHFANHFLLLKIYYFKNVQDLISFNIQVSTAMYKNTIDSMNVNEMGISLLDYSLG